jgi:hypothetical protein
MATTASSARAGTTPPTQRRNATSNSIGVITPNARSNVPTATLLPPLDCSVSRVRN